MAWNEVKVTDQRRLFIELYQQRSNSLSELCRNFNISRKTGYKWIRRFETQGLAGLEDLSRAPDKQGRAVPDDLVDVIISVRCMFRTLGPKKIWQKLREFYPMVDWPSISGIEKILDRFGFSKAREYRKRVPWSPSPPPNPVDCNDTWCADFKGWFLTGDGQKCEPFTLTDLHSRYLLRCVCLARNTEERVWECLKTAFSEYGLPNNFKTDNGSPFASTGAGRLSSLSVKLVKAGINPIFIEPGKPQQNGRHERMHQTLKMEAANPPSDTLEEQIVRLDEFRDFYNMERPHEGLGQQTPESVYKPSTRVWKEILRSPEYGYGYEVRKVRQCGTIKLNGDIIFIGHALAKEPVALREEEEGLMAVYFGPILLGHIDEKKKLKKLERPKTCS